MRSTSRLLALLLVVALAATGCRIVRQVAAKYPRADVAMLYRDAVRNRDRNPVILIPGFGGAQLALADGTKVWGTFFTDDWLPHSTPAGFRALAVDVGRLPERFDHRDLAALTDDAYAVAPLGRFHADAVVADVSFDVYASMIDLLSDAGYISDPGLRQEGYDPDFNNSFTFHYDWRLDNVANARAFGRFLDGARLEVATERRRLGLPERPVRFDVVAHSAGGLIARYYLRYGTADVLDDLPEEVPWTGAADVDRLILISTPNFGSSKALRDMLQGRGFPMVADFQPTLLATMVALYQMLPRPRHDLVVDADGNTVALDFLDVGIWREHGWGPFASEQERYLAWLWPELDAAARQERVAAVMAAAFDRARRFAAALDREPSTRPSTELVLFAGDADLTPHRARLVERGGRLRLSFEGDDLMAPGDGTVTRASALADERLGSARQEWLRSPIPWDWTFFINDRHTTFLRNPILQDNLLHLLLERTPPSRRLKSQPSGARNPSAPPSPGGRKGA